MGALVIGAGFCAGSVALASEGAAGWLETTWSDDLVAVGAATLAFSVVFLGGWGVEQYEGETLGRVGSVRAAGLAVFGLGVVTSVGAWFAPLLDRPIGRLRLGGGEAQTYEAPVSGERMDVMLPFRLTLEDLVLEKNRTAVQVGIARAGSDSPRSETLRPGQPLEAERLRLTPVGLAPEAGGLRAVVGSRREKTIQGAAAVGGTFRLRPDGPRYTVRDIEENYMQALGPAAEIESEEHGRFWVFRRGSNEDSGPEFLHDLYLQDVRRTPGVEFVVSGAGPIWPTGLGGGLVVGGLALLAMAPVARDPSERSDTREGEEE